MTPLRGRAQRGMTLVELMVAMLIGLGVTLAITSLLISGENHKRVTISTNDAEQTGAYVFNALDGVLRGAGSGIAQSGYGSNDLGVLGCKLNGAANGTAIFPRTAAFPAPFSTAFLAGATANLRVAPLLIGKNLSDFNANGQRSDVLVVMGGSGSAGGVSRQVTAGGTSNSLNLDNTVGVSQYDMTLVSQSGVTGGDCLLEEVSIQPGVSTLTFGHVYYTAGTTTTLAALASSTSTYLTPLGNAGANNLQFELIGVGANRTLYTYDLLQNLGQFQNSGGDVAQPIADGVDQMHALYGVDNTGNGTQDTWVDPGAAGYDIVSVMTSAATMHKIVAVRIALVLRGEYYDKHTDASGNLKAVTPPTLTLFGGLTDASGNALPALQQTIALSAIDQQYRYRVFEFTVPLRNMILLAGGP